jgi:hypothetical protein
MPKTRLATARYEVLDRCFSDQTRYYFIEDLHRAVNQELESKGLRTVRKRTVHRITSSLLRIYSKNLIT